MIINQYEELKKILNKLEELEEAKKHIPVVKSKDVKQKNEYIGKKFKMLTVLEKTGKRASNGSLLYKCQCDCGNIVYYSLGDVKKNTSCGCWRKSKGRIDNIKASMKCFENTSIRVLENRKLNQNNTSGYSGVSFNKNKNKWQAYMKLQYKNICLGTFATKEEAIEARKKGEEIYFKPLIEKYNNERSNQ